MITVPEIESALRPVLPPSLYPQLPRLAHLLTETLNHSSTPAEASARLAADPASATLLGALAGRQLALGSQVLDFPAANMPPAATSAASPSADQRQGVFM